MANKPKLTTWADKNHDTVPNFNLEDYKLQAPLLVSPKFKVEKNMSKTSSKETKPPSNTALFAAITNILHIMAYLGLGNIENTKQPTLVLRMRSPYHVSLLKSVLLQDPLLKEHISSGQLFTAPGNKYLKFEVNGSTVLVVAACAKTEYH